MDQDKYNYSEHPDGFIPSIVYYTPDNDTIHFCKPQGDKVVEIPYLKMMLAGMEQPPKPLDKDTIIACSIYFLAHVISQSKSNAMLQNPERFKNRTPSWTGISLGVPVQYLEGETKELFLKILFTADLLVAAGGKTPDKAEYLLNFFTKHGEKVDEERERYHVYPEIIAAVHSFIISRESRSGCYAYFDVGGGTLDGILFSYKNVNGRRLVDVYEGRVKPLGVEKVSFRLMREFYEPSYLQAIKEELYEEKAHSIPVEIPLNNRRVINDVHTHVAEVIFSMKKKVDSMLLEDTSFLPLFIGGGGAGSPWFRNVIRNTYGSRQHTSCGLPPYEEREMTAPKDFILPSGRTCTNYERYAIAYGLSIPPGEEVEINGLPKDAAKREPQVQYDPLQTRMDSIAYNLYGEYV